MSDKVVCGNFNNLSLHNVLQGLVHELVVERLCKSMKSAI